jgi:hypothetical protein
MFGTGTKILLENKKLIIYPLISGVAGLLFFIFVFGIIIDTSRYYKRPSTFDSDKYEYLGTGQRRISVTISRYFKQRFAYSRTHQSSLRILYEAGKIKFFSIVIFACLLQVLIICVNSAFFTAIIDVYHGKTFSIKESFARIYEKRRKILEWAAISLFVGGILYFLRSLISKIPYVNKWYDSLLAKILLSIAGFAWTIGTFFVIPVLVTENIGARDSIKRSMELLKRSWGEQLTGVAVQKAFTACIVCLMAAFFILINVLLFNFSAFFPVLYLSVLTFIIVFICLWLFNIAMSMFRCALYLYAAEGVVPEYFDREEIETAWTVK